MSASAPKANSMPEPARSALMMLAARLIPQSRPIMPREQRMMPMAKAAAKMLDFVIVVSI